MCERQIEEIRKFCEATIASSTGDYAYDSGAISVAQMVLFILEREAG